MSGSVILLQDVLETQFVIDILKGVYVLQNFCETDVTVVLHRQFLLEGEVFSEIALPTFVALHLFGHTSSPQLPLFVQVFVAQRGQELSVILFELFKSGSNFIQCDLILIEFHVDEQIIIMLGQKRVWLDCDPGHDDMLAIIMAAYSQSIDLIGVSTSAGNSSIDNTTQNALNILYQIGKSNIQVIKGASGPLTRKLHTAAQIHGISGLEGAELLVSPYKAMQEKPFVTIYELIMSQSEKIDFVVTGAMTNLAILLKAFPDIKEKIRQITIMGGAVGIGNWSPAAEFNIFLDPEAASIVFQQGLPITMIPLQVTHTVEATQQIFSQFQQLPSSFGKKISPLFRYFQKTYKQDQDFQFPVAHDPCTIYYLLHPEDFHTRKASVSIQTEGYSRGRTNCRFMHFDKYPVNATVCMSLNVENFWKTMLECLRRIK